MTMKLLSFLFWTVTTFSMKRKLTTTKAKIREPNANFTSAYSTPLLGKNMWNIVKGNLTHQSEKKFNVIHKKFSAFPTKYKNISDDINESFFQFIRQKMNWRFFKNLETQETYAENITEKATICGWTALHCAVGTNEVEIAKAVINAGVNIDAKTELVEITALHYAAITNCLEVGRMLVEAGADTDINCTIGDCEGVTAMEIALVKNHAAFAEILSKNTTN